MLTACRLCGSSALEQVLDLGEHALTGVFPASPDEDVPTAPLELVWCRSCTLLQLAHSFEPTEMYGDNYGYRSGLNASMVEHLGREARGLETLVELSPGDVVLDIGSNDGTLLGSYTTKNLRRIGIDPTAAKFADYYPEDAVVARRLLLGGELPEGERHAGPDHHVDRDVLRPGEPRRVRAGRPRLPRAGRRLALRAGVHAVDAELDRVRHGLSRAPRVLLAGHRAPDPRGGRARDRGGPVQPRERRQLRRDRCPPRLADRASACAARLVRGPGGTSRARYRGAVPALRRAGLPAPRRARRPPGRAASRRTRGCSATAHRRRGMSSCSSAASPRPTSRRSGT